MFVTTHSLVAMTIAIKTGNPIIYVPAALANHFVLDFFPHFGIPMTWDDKKRQKTLILLIALDMVVGTSLFFYLLQKTGSNFFWLFSIALLSGWPDLLSASKIVLGKTLNKKFQLFHEKIQNESLWGIIVELLIIALCWYILFIK